MHEGLKDVKETGMSFPLRCLPAVLNVPVLAQPFVISPLCQTLKKKKTFILKINFNAELLLLLFKLLAQDSSHPEWWHLHTDRPPESFQLTCSAPAALGFLSLSLSSDTLMVHEVFRFLHSASRKGSLILGVHYLIICAVSFKKFYASLGKAGVWLLLWGE